MITVGKVRVSHWQAAAQDYQARLQHYTTFQLHAVREQPPNDVALIQALRSAPAPVVLLHTPGMAFSSSQLAHWLEQQLTVYHHLTLAIGGAAGFEASTLATYPQHLALSALTLPHELALVVLLEQLYRAFSIWQGEPYHK